MGDRDRAMDKSRQQQTVIEKGGGGAGGGGTGTIKSQNVANTNKQGGGGGGNVPLASINSIDKTKTGESSQPQNQNAATAVTTQPKRDIGYMNDLMRSRAIFKVKFNYVIIT